MEVEKWKRHFRRMADGKLLPNRDGKFVVDDGNQSGGSSLDPSIKFVTSVAQDVELAKSELKENAYKGKPVYQVKISGPKPKKRKSGKGKKPRVQDLVWPYVKR